MIFTGQVIFMDRKTSKLILCAILLIALSFTPSQTSTATDGIGNVQLCIPGESVSFNEANQMMMITGFWHTLEFNTPSGVNVSVELTKGIDKYEWTHRDGVWSDVEHDLFIDETKCSHIGTIMSFWIAVDHSAATGVWQLSITAGELESEQDIVLLARTGGVGFSTPDFFIEVPPHTQVQVDTADTGQYMKVQNEDVVPVNVDFFINDEDFAVTPDERSLSPFSLGEYSLVYSGTSHASQRQELVGQVLITYKYVGPSMGTAQLIPSYNYPFDIIIFTGDPNLEIIETAEYTVQYVTSVRMASNETRAFPLIIDGLGDVDLDINGVSCAVSSIELNGVEIEMPFHLELVGDRAESFNITVEPTITSGNASIVYHINGDQYTTVIEIDSAGEPQEVVTESNGGNLSKILPAVVIGLIIVALFTRHYTKKRSVKR
jgi:hypothetical protein